MFKHSPITRELIPDEMARNELYFYVNARPSKWPAATFVVGNPPFVGNKRMRKRLGRGHVEAVRSAHPGLWAEIDLFMYTPTRPGSTTLGLKEAYRSLRISPEEFDEVAVELGRTLDAVKLPEAEKGRSLGSLRGTQRRSDRRLCRCGDSLRLTHRVSLTPAQQRV